MQAIILAAGMGKRLKELTANNTKCMIEINGVTLIERLLKQIDDRNFSRIILVVGYKQDALKEYIAGLPIKTEIIYVENKDYETTNNIYSLSLAKDYLAKEDTIIFESDTLFEDSILDDLINDENKDLALVAKYESWMDGSRVELDENNKIIRYVPENEFLYTEDVKYNKAINIYKLSKKFINEHYLPQLNKYLKDNGYGASYEQVMKVLTASNDVNMQAKIINDQKWCEINDLQDVELATINFNENEEERAAMIQRSFGGYWRFPGMLDYNFLVNPYFPPQKLLNEIKANFDNIITQYPSGLRVNSILAAKCFQVSLDNIVLGNGTSEYIKLYMENVKGNVGFISPTFEEYPNRYEKSKSIVYIPDNINFKYDEKDIINFFKDKDVQTIVVVNPDNPSGNYITKQGLLDLAKWSKENNINLVVDESFVDFAEEENATLIEQDILDTYPNLVILKSISKSYGVPGLRLGVLVSGNKELVDFIKKKAAIWNINSLAEFYMQIEGKYHKDYAEALVQIKKERNRFYQELIKLPHMHVIPSQANYIMIELKDGLESKVLARNLLNKYNIFIKDLYNKTGGKNYIRIAVRNTEDNNRLLQALEKELNI